MFIIMYILTSAIKIKAHRYSLLFILGIKKKDFWKILYKDYCITLLLIGVKSTIVVNLICLCMTSAIWSRKKKIFLIDFLKNYFISGSAVCVILVLLILVSVIIVFYHSLKRNMLEFWEGLNENISYNYDTKVFYYLKPILGVCIECVVIIFCLNYHTIYYAAVLQLISFYLISSSTECLRWNIRTREKNINYVIKNLNLTIKDNEFIVVVGKSGIGKTTLLKMLGGIEKPSAGSIFYTNKELYQCKESEMEGYRRKEIGFIFQDYRLLDEMTVRENILVPQILDGARSTIAERKMKKLTKVLGISEKKDYYPYELSGGEKQRVAICRALINEPKVILADEPTGNLDTFNTELILEILLRIKIELKKTIILVTHDKGICKFADRIIEMKNGKLQEQNIK